MKRILFLSFYFEPDLSAGSFRNTTLAKTLAAELGNKAEIDVFTTMPNRYQSFQRDAPAFEKTGNINLYRISIPQHNSNFLDQIKSFSAFFYNVKKQTRDKKYDLVFASSSRLFTAFLGHQIARKKKVPFYVDIRDIFYDSMKDVLGKNPMKLFILPFLKLVEMQTFTNANHINLISRGFEPYFMERKKNSFSFFTNGIDENFLSIKYPGKEIISPYRIAREKKVILYAGNIGEGQGLHKFIPALAKKIEDKYDFIVIGDGGAKGKLTDSIEKYKCTNVCIKDPVNRASLMKEYFEADFFLIHLNDFKAFRKVLPSKIFELGSMDKPIIAGVSGYSAEFISENLSNVILVKPCDVDACAEKLMNYNYVTGVRSDFIEKFNRHKINREMASSIISFLPAN